MSKEESIEQGLTNSPAITSIGVEKRSVPASRMQAHAPAVLVTPQLGRQNGKCGLMANQKPSREDISRTSKHRADRRDLPSLPFRPHAGLVIPLLGGLTFERWKSGRNLAPALNGNGRFRNGDDKSFENATNSGEKGNLILGFLALAHRVTPRGFSGIAAMKGGDR